MASIGRATINTHALVEHECSVGSYSHIAVNATIAGRSKVGDHVFVGAGATVIDGVHIADRVTVGAAATVVMNIAEPGTYVGCPARRDPWALADVALATNCIMTLLAERTERPLFAVETLLNRDQLAAIGARQMPKKLEASRKSGGRDRDRTCDPYHVKVVLFR